MQAFLYTATTTIITWSTSADTTDTITTTLTILSTIICTDTQIILYYY